jgi:hypothetical protein
MDPIKFAHIAPTNFLHFTGSNGIHLLLAHLVESDPVYANYYANLDDGKLKILDNSAFEMYKQRKPMYPSDKLIEMGQRIKADYIVMSDYPGEPGCKTIEAAEKLIPEFKAAGFKAFFVPQSVIGDFDDYVDTFLYGVRNDDIDLVGVSILGVPNAYEVERGNQLQRYLCRYHLMSSLRDWKLLNFPRKLHFLGMTDGPNEIKLLRDFHEYIFSWDSSSAVWAGLNGIMYDNTPTGLINGKFEKEVDFNLDSDYNYEEYIVRRNIAKIDRMCYFKEKS